MELKEFLQLRNDISASFHQELGDLATKIADRIVEKFAENKTPLMVPGNLSGTVTSQEYNAFKTIIAEDLGDHLTSDIILRHFDSIMKYCKSHPEEAEALVDKPMLDAWKEHWNGIR